MTPPSLLTIPGEVIIIGFGSIARGFLPLLFDRCEVDPDRVSILAPTGENDAVAEGYGVARREILLSEANYREVLAPTFAAMPAGSACVNLSVDTSSVDIMRLARNHGVLYIDTVIEPWPGLYDNSSLPLAQRTNYALREQLLAERHRAPGGVTAVSACGANPGMVSWFVKQALLDVAAAADLTDVVPETREQWARLMQKVGVRGIHIAERDTQQSSVPRSPGAFVNTWSVDGFISEGLQPAELGWGTHEHRCPAEAGAHEHRDAPSIYLRRPGIATQVRTWCPTRGPQIGFCVTHNESISIAAHFSLVDDGGGAIYRPTCHYAYLPCDDAVLSWRDLLGGSNGGPRHVLDVDEISSGIDELGVLLYGHDKNAYWFGSRLSNDETKDLAPHQNATGLQVTSAVLAGLVWAYENPERGIVEADELDFARCLEIQRDYLGPVEGHFTDWTPLAERSGLYPDPDADESDPWQFTNVLVR